MTLKSVAARMKDPDSYPYWHEYVIPGPAVDVIEAFESDPEFTLPERVEALAKELDGKGTLFPDPVWESNDWIVTRLRELLGEGGK
jgi:hypothetical protein